MIFLFTAFYFFNDSHAMEESNKRKRDACEEKEEQLKEDEGITNHLYSLPTELSELIFLFCFKSIFEDTISGLKRAPSEEFEIRRLAYQNGEMPLTGELFRAWKNNLPYPKFLSLIKSFCSEKRKELIASTFIKRELRKLMNYMLIELFKSNDAVAGNFLSDILMSNFLSYPYRLKSDILLFVRCLVESGLHPEHPCYFFERGHRKEVERIADEPFSLMEFARSIKDDELIEFLVNKRNERLKKFQVNSNV